MQELILVRHSLPEIDPNIPPDRWVLSDLGRRLCKPLAARLAAYRPDLIVSSKQPKAVETGRAVADIFGLPFKTADDLHEVDWRAKANFLTKERYETTIVGLFRNPQQVVFGRETADEAHQRFSKALGRLVGENSEANLVVVAHGIVITLLVSRATGMDPFHLWKRLGTPSFVAMSLPELSVDAVVEGLQNGSFDGPG